MLDVMSTGRLVAGMVIGGGPEYFSYESTRPRARALPRGARPDPQGLDRAGPVPFRASTTSFRYVNPWPRPLAAAAPADLDPRRRQHGDHRVRGPAPVSYMGMPYFHIRRLEGDFGMFREACQQGGLHAPTRARWAGACQIYVAETDKQAREEFEPHFWYLAKKLLRLPLKYMFPPEPHQWSPKLRPCHPSGSSSA